MRLQSKIVLALIPLIVLPLAITGWISYGQLHQMTERKAFDEIKTIMRQLELLIHERVKTAEANIELFSRSSLLEKYIVTADDEERYALMQPPLLRLFDSYQKVYPDYYEIRVLLPDGFEDSRVVSNDIENKTEEEAGSDFFISMKQADSDLLTRFFLSEDNNEYALLVSKRIRLSDRASDPVDAKPALRGFLAITVDLGFIEGEIVRNRVGREGFFFLTDTNGTILFHPDLHKKNEVLSEDVHNKLTDQTDVWPIEITHEDEQRLFFRSQPHPQLFLFAQLPEKELVAGSRRLGYIVMTITLLAILIISTLLIYLSKKFLVSPIIKLNRASHEFGRGHFSHHIDIGTKDEVGELAEALKKMSSNLKKSNEQVKFIAYHDNLTGLPNRRMFNEYLEHLIAQARRADKMLALLFVDIDDFKRINDTLGHEVGDELLKEAADRFQAALRKEDYVARTEGNERNEAVARLGGDEFTLILPLVNDPFAVATVAKRLLSEASRPFRIDKNEVVVTASIGIATYPQDGEDVSTLVRNADTAMYHAKEEGKNTYQYYSHEMNVAALERLTMEGQLRKAVENEEFVLYYQPMVNAINQKIVGLEALIRWQHPEIGMVSPMQFIPLAEETGLVVPIGEWVLREACRQVKEWMSYNIAPDFVSVNLSSQQFKRQNIAELIGNILEGSKLPPQYLDVELTESSLMEAEKPATEMLNEIKKLGVRVSLDDFGTGYSSLSYLRRFPIDNLKIDRSFVRNVVTDESDAAIVSAIIGMAQSLKLNIIAEGIETKEQLDFICEKGCQLIQGYYFSPPLPKAEIVKLLTNPFIKKGKTQ